MSEKKKESKDVSIFVSRKKGTSRLHFRDSEGHSGDYTITTDVRPGGMVKWEVEDGVDTITNIYPKKGSFSIFEKGPEKKKNGEWFGKIKKDATGREEYNVDYIIDGKEYSEDPVLNVKPPTKP